MITVANAPEDKDLAARIRQDLQAAGYDVGDTAQPGAGNMLVLVLSPSAAADSHVTQAMVGALDNNQHIIPVLAKSTPVPKLIDHLTVLDFSQQYDAETLRSTIAALTAPGASRPMTVITPKVQKANRRIGMWLAGLSIIWFIIALILVGVFHIQAPTEEYNTVDTLEAATIQVVVGRNLPRTTQDALNFSTTLQAAPTAQRPLLIATATAMVATRPPR
jgi:hypothetical protein